MKPIYCEKKNHSDSDGWTYRISHCPYCRIEQLTEENARLQNEVTRLENELMAMEAV